MLENAGVEDGLGTAHLFFCLSVVVSPDRAGGVVGVNGTCKTVDV